MPLLKQIAALLSAGNSILFYRPTPRSVYFLLVALRATICPSSTNSGAYGVGFYSGRGILLVLSIISVALAPLLNALIEKYESRIPNTPLKFLLFTMAIWNQPLIKIRRHVVIVGYGRIGKAVAKMLKDDAPTPHLVIERELQPYDEAIGKGHSCLYADATHKYAFTAANTRRATLVVITEGSYEVMIALAACLHECLQRPVVHVRVNTEQEASRIQADFRSDFPNMTVICAEHTMQSPFIESVCQTLGIKKLKVPHHSGKNETANK